MAKIAQIIEIVEQFSPQNATQPNFEDNVGLIIGDADAELSGVVTCLDCTSEVVDEAIERGANLILTHHPVIFKGIKSIAQPSPLANVILKAISNSISIYSAHTNLDFCKGGINDYNADLLRLTNVKPMEVIDGIMVGRIGKLPSPMSLSELAQQCRQKYSDKYARMIGDGSQLIRNVAVINGGAGSIEYIKLAKCLGADCYISADFPHHALLYGKSVGVGLVAVGHYNMEHVFIKKWTEHILDKAKSAKIEIKIEQSRRESDPTKMED